LISKAIVGHGVEVIFVSSDKTAADMLGYMREFHGDWWALPHGSDAGQMLRGRFAISSIPTVIVCRRSDGAIITKDGRGDSKKETQSRTTVKVRTKCTSFFSVQSRGPAAVNYWK
jgi:hypothetical protein